MVSNDSKAVSYNGSILTSFPIPSNGSGSYTYAITSGPSYGSVTNNNNGTYAYTPNQEFDAIDSFEYFANDTTPFLFESPSSGTGTITITVSPFSTKDIQGNPLTLTESDAADFGQILTNTGNSAATVTFNLTSADKTYSGAIQNGTNPIHIVISGGKTLTLSNTNTYTGTTTISEGSLFMTGSIDNSSSIINNASLIFHQSSNHTYSHGISGTGSLVQQGSGVLTLSGTNTYSGTTMIASGTCVTTLNPHTHYYSGLNTHLVITG